MDFYLPDGRWARQIVWLRTWENEMGWFASLRRSGYPAPFALIEARSSEARARGVYQAFDAWCPTVEVGARSDSPMEWVALEAAEPPIERFPPRYRWTQSGGWKLDAALEGACWGDQ